MEKIDQEKKTNDSLTVVVALSNEQLKQNPKKDIDDDLVEDSIVTECKRNYWSFY